MLNTKFDLYRAEWLDLVFTDRNKNYGAYELRQHYASTMIKAMGITFFTVGAAIAIYSFTLKPVIAEPPLIGKNDREIPVTLDPVKPTEPIKEATQAPKPEPVKPAAAAPAVSTTAIPTEVVRDELATIDPPKIDDIKGAIGPTNIDGANVDNISVANVTAPGGNGPGTADGTESGNEVYPFSSIEVMPEPIGGAQAWGKFLQKNLRYPAAAESEGINGRVFLSFIIEKDGHLSSFKIEKGAGFGFDEESLRVLKLAPAWKPGIQNGRPVRVKYTIPINFRAPDL